MRHQGLGTVVAGRGRRVRRSASRSVPRHRATRPAPTPTPGGVGPSDHSSNQTVLCSPSVSAPYREAGCSTSAGPCPVPAYAGHACGTGPRSGRRSVTRTRTRPSWRRTVTSNSVRACSTALVAGSPAGSRSVSTRCDAVPGSAPRTKSRAAAALAGSAGKRRDTAVGPREPMPRCEPGTPRHAARRPGTARYGPFPALRRSGDGPGGPEDDGVAHGSGRPPHTPIACRCGPAFSPVRGAAPVRPFRAAQRGSVARSPGCSRSPWARTMSSHSCQICSTRRLAAVAGSAIAACLMCRGSFSVAARTTRSVVLR